MQVQDSKNLDHPQLLSQAISREVDEKRSIRIRTSAHIAARLLCRPLISFLKKIYLFLLERWIYREEERKTEKIFHLMVHRQLAATAGAEPIKSKEPGASSGSPTLVQDLKALDHPQLLSQATSRELDGKQGHRD